MAPFSSNALISPSPRRARLGYDGDVGGVFLKLHYIVLYKSKTRPVAHCKEAWRVLLHTKLSNMFNKQNFFAKYCLLNLLVNDPFVSNPRIQLNKGKAIKTDDLWK